MDSRLGRAVAVKMSHERFSDRFERETRAIAALNHPHICTLHDVFLRIWTDADSNIPILKHAQVEYATLR